MKKILILFLFLNVSQVTFAQALVWVKQAGSPTSGSSNSCITNKIVVDALLNTYITGYFIGTINFGGTTLTSTSIYYYDAFVAKYNSAGNLVWIKQGGAANHNTIANDVATDPSGNVYITGSFQISATFSGTTIQGNSTSQSTMFIAKYNNDGTLQWVLSDGIGCTCAGNGINVDNAGNVYVIGNIQGDYNSGTTTANFSGTILSATYPAIYTAKYNYAGTLQWVNNPKATPPVNGYNGVVYGKGIKVDANGNQYITGLFAGSVNFLGTILTTPNTVSDTFLAKCDASGTLIWINQVQNTPPDNAIYVAAPVGIALDNSGNVFLAGSFDGTINLSGTVLHTLLTFNPNKPNYDTFLAKYNNNGTLVWAKSVVQTQAYNSYHNTANISAFAADASGNTYIIDYVYGTFNISGTTVTNSATSGYDAIIAKYDNTGTFQFVKQVTGTSPGYSSMGNSVAVAGNGNIYALGTFSGATNFFGTPLSPLAANNTDTFILSLQPSPCPNSLAPTGTITTNQKASTTVITIAGNSTNGTLNTIPNGANVIYQAGSYVLLNTGFVANNTSVFTAKILSGCN